MKNLLFLSFIGASLFVYCQNNYLSNVLIVKAKESHRRYFYTGETSNAKLEFLYNKYGVSSISRTYPYCTKPRAEGNEFGIKYADLSLIYTIEYSVDVDPKKLIDKFMSSGAFQYVEPSYTFQPLYTPNDPEIDSLYFLDLLNLYTAWDTEKGDTNVVIGISDTGFDIDHPDLMNSVKYNYADPINGIDDDGDGYTDNFRGWDLGDNDNDPSVGGDWHGVYVSSFVGATADNGIQLAGTGFNCKIVPIKMESGGALTHAYQSITYAANQGFNIVNCSWGAPDSWSQQGQDVVTYATINKNCLVIAAAGNDNSDSFWYPASFDWVLSVGGTNKNNEKWVQSAGEGSTFNDYVDVMAPSVDLYRVNNGGGAILGNGRGTSFSAPMASGVAGLIKSKYSAFSALQVLLQLKATSTNIDTVPNNSSYQGKLGRGLINAQKAVTDLSNPGLIFDNAVFTDNDDEYYGVGDTVYLYGSVINLLQNSSASTKYKLTTESPYVQLLDSVVDLGSILFNTSKNTSSLRLSFIIKDNMPKNETVMFKVIMEDGDYYNWKMLTKVFNPDHINIEENNIKFSVGASGKLGFNGAAGSQTIGQGVKYKNGSNILFQMSVLATLNETQTSYVLDGDYQTANDIDSSMNMEADMVVYSSYNDDPAAVNKIGIEINQKSMAWSEIDRMDFIILEMNIKNTSGSEINGLNFGIFADWDIPTYSQNYAVYDSTFKTGYAYTSGGTYGGIHVISDGSINNYAFDNNGANGTISHYDGFSSAEQHTSISGGILKDSAGLGDVSNIIGLGGLNIGVNDSIKVAFALVVGDNYSTLKKAALESDTAYHELYNLSTKILLADSSSCNFNSINSCDGKAKVEASGGAGKISYSWYDVPGNPSGDSVSELCAGTYHVEISDELELKDTLTVTIGEPDAFYVNLGNDTSICQGDSITFDAGPDYTYFWSTGETSRQIIASSAALYSVTVTNSNPCSVSDTINLTVNTLPVINFTDTTMSNGMACNGSVNGFVSGGYAPYGYTWSDDNERDSIHAINLCPNMYTLTVTDQNSCVDVDSIEIKDQMMVNKNTLLKNYSIYPNPTGGNIYLKGIPVNAKVYVTDILGNIILSNQRINSVMDFSDFSSGTYFVNVVIDEIRSVKKITVKK
tara:strand:+ start:5087 stop:8506 length:3420 start_codon:yes stop_codon:yes gene_type:complete